MNEKQIQEVMELVQQFAVAVLLNKPTSRDLRAAIESALREQPTDQSSCYCPNCEALGKELAALREQVREVPEDCDVRKIMLAIEPGPDGMGVEVYAKNCAAVEERLTAMACDLEEWQLGIRRLSAPTQPAQQEQDLAYREAAQLATALFKKHYASNEEYATGQVVWGLCDSTAGIISQIDNMVAGLVMPQPAHVPEVHFGKTMKPETLRSELQKKCSAWGAYWRGSDAHGVELTTDQAVELLQNALNVEVEIKDEEATQPAQATGDK